MKRDEIFAKLNKVFRDEFDDEEIIVDEATTAADIDGWDSLEHINLISAVENEFGIRFNMGEVNSMVNVGGMVDLIQKKLG